MNKWIIILAACLGTLVPGQAFCQYQSTLYDVDSTHEFGENIFLNNDGTMFLYGGSRIRTTLRQDIGWFTLSSNGSQKLNLHVLGNGSNTYAYYPSSTSILAKMKRLPDSSFIAPYTIDFFNPAAQPRAMQGILHLGKQGTIISSHTYTDTTNQYDQAYDVAQLPDGGFILGGQRQSTDINKDSAVLTRTDSAGNMLWQRSYKLYTQWGSGFMSVQYLDSGKMVVGGWVYGVGSDNMYTYRPWFLLMDTAGSVLHQRFYSSGYRGGGNIYKDKNGGYIQYGNTGDILIPGTGLSGPLDYRNYPGYVAHLDDNFNFTWTYKMYDSPTQPTYNAFPDNVKQLADSGYLVLAEEADTIYHLNYSRVIKLDKYGQPTWQRTFYFDTTYESYLVDAVEKPDGNLLLFGTGATDNNPAWRGYDFWLLGLDSNGCNSPGCMLPATGVPAPVAPAGVSVYPNPTTGVYHVTMLHEGSLVLYDIQGRVIGSTVLRRGENELALPEGVAAGIYVARIRDKQGGVQAVRLVYAP